ncbi:RDD family protein [Streptomyces sp. NPDC088194]|uniref:RDD family protein n=1 Tax=Streptomyces sp. NPDC088194 TaxID=3154931 RepID=UPI00344C1078
MSAPTSGSSGSSASSQPSASAGGSGAPVPGYYPDPSIPHYIRYWNGSAWVPGTSRPAPVDEAPPGRVEPVDEAPPGRAAASGAPALDESGPMFLDEDPAAPTADHWPTASQEQVPAPPPEQWRPAPDPRAHLAQDPAPSWPVPQARPEPQLPPISWGAPAQPQTPAQPQPQSPAPSPAPAPGPAPAADRAPQPALPRPQERQSLPAAGSAPAGQQPPLQAQPPLHPRPAPQPSPLVPAPAPAPEAAAQASPPWAAQVQDLARGEGGVVPWRPPASDPFGVSQGQDRPGGLVRRFLARLVDAVVLAAVTGVAAVPLGTAAYHHAKDKVDQARLTGETVKVWLIDGTTGVQLGVVLATFLVAGVLLEVLPTARWGRTLGKRLVGLRVLDIEAQLPPGFGASVRRWLLRTVLNLLVVGVVGVAWCLFDRPWKQCWHDKAARTFVARG